MIVPFAAGERMLDEWAAWQVSFTRRFNWLYYALIAVCFLVAVLNGVADHPFSGTLDLVAAAFNIGLLMRSNLAHQRAMDAIEKRRASYRRAARENVIRGAFRQLAR